MNGACRTQELVDMTVENIEFQENVLIVKLPNTKTKIPRSFVIRDEFHDIVKRYFNLRPGDLKTNRFFMQYRDKKCVKQVVGKNKISAVPKEIATYLNLPNPQDYTGHCFRRTSATILADSGADLTTIKRHGGWKSSNVAEGYIDDSVGNKTRINNQITESINMHSDQASSPRPSTSAAWPEAPRQPDAPLAPRASSSAVPIAQPSLSQTSQTNINLPRKNITLSFNNCNNFNINFN